VKLWLFGLGWILRVHIPVVMYLVAKDYLVVVPSTPTSPSSFCLWLRSCIELDLFLEEEPTPLSCCPVDKFRRKSGKSSPDWVLQLVQESSHFVGLSCDGFRGRVSALYEDIVARNDENEAGPSSNLGNKGTREMNMLDCYVNYDSHCGSTFHGRNKGRVHRGLL